MPFVHLSIEDTNQSVSRRISYKIVEDLAVSMGFPPDTQIRLPGSSSDENLQQSLKERLGEVQTDTRFNVHVTADEYFLDEDIERNVVSPNYTQPIFNDPKRGCKIVPIYGRRDLKMNITFRFPSFTHAQRVMNDLRFYAAKRRDWFWHEVRYHYLIPKAAYTLISKIHELVSNKTCSEEDNVSLNEYMRRYFDEQVATVSDQSGEYVRLSKEEVQIQLVGYPNFVATPEQSLQQASEDGSVSVEFEYNVSFDKPISLFVEYPFAVHNQPLPSEYYDHLPKIYLQGSDKNLNFVTSSLEPWTRTLRTRAQHDGVPIPSFLDWVPNDKPPFLHGVFRALLLLGEDSSPFQIIDLKNLSNYEFPDSIIDFLSTEREYITFYRKSIFHLRLYENGYVRDGRFLKVDPDLKVDFDVDRLEYDQVSDKEHQDLSPCKQYLLTFDVLVNLFHLTDDALDRLAKHPQALTTILRAIDPNIKDDKLPNVRNGKANKKQLLELAKEINKSMRYIQGYYRAPYYQVGSFYITVNERSEA